MNRTAHYSDPLIISFSYSSPSPLWVLLSTSLASGSLTTGAGHTATPTQKRAMAIPMEELFKKKAIMVIAMRTGIAMEVVDLHMDTAMADLHMDTVMEDQILQS